MRIVYIYSNPNAVGQYRVKHPAAALQALGHDTYLIKVDNNARRTSGAEIAGDILVLQRQMSTDIFDMLAEFRPEDRPKVVYEVDDDPWEWHSWDPVHRELGANYARQVTKVMSLCDAVTCSTRTLARRIRLEMPGKPIWVIPNAIDFQIRDWSIREKRQEYGLEGKTVLGWTGSIHHERDVNVMFEAIPEILDGYPDTVLLLQCDPAVYVRKVDGLRRLGLGDRVKWASPVPFETHPSIYSLFDVNLAPLEITQFNLCKSDLRLIEGGAHGVPYVATNIAPYLEMHEESGGVGGYLADTPADWVNAIEDLIDDEEPEGPARGQSLRRYVRQRRSLEVSVGQWQAAYQSILADHQGEAVEPLGQIPGRNDPCPCGSGLKYKKCHRGSYG